MQNFTLNSHRGKMSFQLGMNKNRWEKSRIQKTFKVPSVGPIMQPKKFSRGCRVYQ